MLSGKLALITGGGSGIGRAACLILAREGAEVIAADRNPASAQETVSLIKNGTKHSSLEVDVSSPSSVQACMQQVLKIYTRPPNVIVNSAGVTRDSFLLKMSFKQFQEAIDINLTGTFNVVQAACALLVESKQPGSIITVGSIVGQIGNIGQANYAASKAGVEALTKTVAKEMGSFGIRCNAVIPGFIETPIIATVPEKVKDSFRKLIPLARFGDPAEVGELIAFLSSDRSSYINGTSINITGGL